jgi:hypothetical protein
VVEVGDVVHAGRHDPGGQPDETPMIDWREVDLDGAVAEGLSNVCHYGRGVHVWGHREDRPFAATVLPAGKVGEVLPSWRGRVSGVLQDDMGDLHVTGGDPPRTHPGGDAAEWSAVDESDPYVAGWVVMGDEDPCNLALSASGRLHAYEYGGEAPQPGPRLAGGPMDEELVVAGREIGLVVAGRLAPDVSAPATDGVGPSAWSYANGEWTEIGVADAPDGYTDSYTRWEPVLAGHRDGRPLVLSHTGTPLPAPQVDLDPARPHVCVAHVDGAPYGSEEPGWGGRLVLVVQAVEGVQVWLHHSRGWTMVPGPYGTLQAARLGYNEKDTGWVVTDGRLWSADLSAVWAAIG